MSFLGVPSAYQQKRIKELNSTLQREQLEGLQVKDRMIMVGFLFLPSLKCPCDKNKIFQFPRISNFFLPTLERVDVKP